MRLTAQDANRKRLTNTGKFPYSKPRPECAEKPGLARYLFVASCRRFIPSDDLLIERLDVVHLTEWAETVEAAKASVERKLRLILPAQRFNIVRAA